MSSPQPDPATGPAAAVTGARPPLRRSTQDRVFAGVCGGLAERYGVPVTALRIAFGLLALTGVGIALYVVIAIACPVKDDPRAIAPARVLVALVAGLVALALSAELLHAVGIGRYAIGRSGSVLLIVFLAGLGSALVVGRGTPIAGAAPDAAPAGAAPRRLPRPHPPVLLLLTTAAAAMAATGAWFGTDGPDGEDAFGAVLAAAVVVVGLGVTLSAWRGRSFVLYPLGLVLAAPLVLVGFADVSLTVGRDNPGVIRSADGPVRTVVLAQGAGPVQVRSAAVAAGLRTLMVRKGVGHVEVIVDRAVPVRLRLVAAGGTVAVDDIPTGAYTSFRTARSHSMFLAAEGRTTTPPLDLRVEVGFGSVLVEHGRPAVAAVRSQVAALQSFRAQVVADIAARTALLRTDRRTLRRLTAAYAEQLRLLRHERVAARRGSLRLPESFWQAVSPASARLAAVDPALHRIERLGLLRFNLLRAAWRTHTDRRGLRAGRAQLRALDRGIAAAKARAGGKP
jgi:phage shock protein C